MKTRYLELDLLRGVAVIGMIIFHFFFILNFYGVMENEMFSGWWQIFAQFVRFTFLGLVGIGMVISYQGILAHGGGRWRAILRQLRRAFVVFVCAFLVSMATYIYISDSFVRFGILHLIAVSIFFWSFFVEWKWLVLILAFVSFWLGGLFGNDVVFDGMLPWFRVDSLDYFPLFPWIGVVGVGIFIGHLFYSTKSQWTGLPTGQAGLKLPLNFWPIRVLSMFGKKALLIYLVHVPIIVLVLWIMGLVSI